ncbi:MAG: nuclear transport factor 2 family protein [Acidobacteriota bacterium]|nr:nuclear transport factor 2 family protein [Acidobacteriota bacterium]
MKAERERVRRRAAAAVLLAAMFAASARAQEIPELAIDGKTFPRALIAVVEAERAFALFTAEAGMKKGFLRYAAPDAVIFRRTPVNAIEAWTQTNPPPPGLLTWYPTYADVSRAGDLGWTTGPYEFREKTEEKQPAASGHYVTLWRRQPDGAFKFVLDFGIRHDAPAAKETGLQYPPSARKAGSEGKGDKGRGVADVEAARTSLFDAERALAADSAREGSARALLSRADDSFRLYRQNSFPFVGREAARKALEGKTDVVTWKAAKAEVSRSGDLGYAYGTYESKRKASDAKPAEQGNYMRIWKREGGTWRVVLDVTSAVRPQ